MVLNIYEYQTLKKSLFTNIWKYKLKQYLFKILKENITEVKTQIYFNICFHKFLNSSMQYLP